MVKYSLYLGLNDKITKTQKIDTIEAYKIIENLLIKYCDGATIFNANGFYRHDDGSISFENSLKIELLFVDLMTIKIIINELKTIFNQESIAMTTEIIESELM